MTIWKFTLKAGETMLRMPAGAQVLTVQEQHGQPQLWAMVEPLMPKVDRLFRIYGTGHEILAGARTYIDTFQIEGGASVFHVFEEGAE